MLLIFFEFVRKSNKKNKYSMLCVHQPVTEHKCRSGHFQKKIKKKRSKSHKSELKIYKFLKIMKLKIQK